MSRAEATGDAPLLVLNAGSSSVKFSVFDAVGESGVAGRLHGEVDAVGQASRLRVSAAGGARLVDATVAASNYAAAVEVVHHWLEAHLGGACAWSAVGHRIVHGGTRYADPVVVDPAVLADLEALVPLAPLHQPQQIAAIRAIGRLAPGAPQIACFDTAFHRAEPPLAQMYALPRNLSAKGYRGYGFHGLSYESIVAALRAIAPACTGQRIVVAHLGNGASMCAIAAGIGIATTMGFTALEGLPMGSRCGALDPGLVLHLLRHEVRDADALETLFYEGSGLLGVSGISSDMRVLLASDSPAAREAIDLFVYRIGRALGSLAAALGGLDALVFTGGIGENAAPIRARVLRDASWLGLTVDEGANVRGGPKISRNSDPVSAWVVASDENQVIARHTRQLLAQPHGGSAT